MLVGSLSVIAFALQGQDDRRDLTRAHVRVQRKVALVIGEQAYTQSPLKNPRNDAVAVNGDNSS